MTATPIAVLQKAADLDLKLGFKPPDTLTMEAAKRWPREFAQILPDYFLQLPLCVRLNMSGTNNGQKPPTAATTD